jgi:hypothetical protein
MKKIISLFVATFLLSCSSSNTTIVNSWKDPNTSVSSEQFKKVLVVALLKDDVTRRVVESNFHEFNPIFKTSFTFLHQGNKDITQDLLIKLLNLENFDGVVTLRLADTKVETDYIPGMNTSLYYANPYFGNYNGYGTMFSGWYSYYSPFYYDLGYYVENTYYFIETNIFSLKNNKLIWSGTTKSSNVPGNIDETTRDIINEIVNQMRKDGSLPPKK